MPKLFKALQDILEFGIIGVIKSSDFTLWSFIFLGTAVVIYGNLMLNKDEVYEWETALQLIAWWLLFSILGGILPIAGAIAVDKIPSKLFVFGLMGISAAYVVISIRAFFERDGCIAWWVSLVFMLRGIYDFLICVAILFNLLKGI